MSLINDLESDIARTQEKLDFNATYLTQIIAALEKLNFDRLNINQENNILTGRLGALQDILKKVKKENIEEDSPHETA